MSDWISVAGQAAGWLIQQPAVQGVVVAAATEAVKRAPAGPSGGPGVRLVAALLAVASTVAAAAAHGDVAQADPQVLGHQVLEAVGAFLAAVGAWQLARRKQA